MRPGFPTIRNFGKSVSFEAQVIEKTLQLMYTRNQEELHPFPYTHSGVTASAIAMNKIYFKRLVINATENSNDPINFPKTLEILPDRSIDFKNHCGAFVLKPINGGSSVGVEIIRERNQVPIINSAASYNLMAEEYFFLLYTSDASDDVYRGDGGGGGGRL